jgi:tryptophan synthase beta chain
VSRTDDEALAAIERLARTEGILCALETAHAVAALDEVKRALATPDPVIIVGLSGRGDKDMVTIAQRRQS